MSPAATPDVEAFKMRPDEKIPHEVGAFERMRINGWPAPKIAEHFGIKQSAFVKLLQRDIDARETAEHDQRPIHAGTVGGRK